MKPYIKDQISCATVCERCDQKLNSEDKRILSVYDHKTICMDCKKKEEGRTDYVEASKEMINQCLEDTELQWGDPENFCFYHFYPFKC